MTLLRIPHRLNSMHRKTLRTRVLLAMGLAAALTASCGSSSEEGPGSSASTAGSAGSGGGVPCTTACSESVLCYDPDGSRAKTDGQGGPTSCAAAVHAVGGACPEIPLQELGCFPLGTCWFPEAVTTTTPVGDACCYKMKACVNYCCGRPIFVDGSARVAELVRGHHWADAPASWS